LRFSLRVADHEPLHATLRAAVCRLPARVLFVEESRKSTVEIAQRLLLNAGRPCGQPWLSATRFG
jgi:hypothetical protein